MEGTAMTPEQQRIAIAEACGWTIAANDSEFVLYWHPSKSEMVRYPDKAEYNQLPNYLNDLNAMHEAEKVLSRGDGYYQRGGYGLYKTALAEVCDEQHPIDATAAQRAEAFLRTLNRWKEI